MSKNNRNKVNKKIRKLLAGWDPPSNKEWAEDITPLMSLRIASEIIRKHKSEIGTVVQGLKEGKALNDTKEMLLQSKISFSVLSSVCACALDRLDAHDALRATKSK